MQYTTFNQQLWALSTFDTVGYDKDQKKLNIHFFDGRIQEYEGVDEETLFSFIISTHKEKFLQDHIPSPS